MTVPPEHAAVRPLTPAQMREDLGCLRFALAHAHAAPYRYISATDLGRRLDAVDQGLSRSMSALDFYRLLAPLIAAIRNSHTSIQAPADALRMMRAHPTAFPIIVRFREGHALVERNLSGDASIRTGDEIVAINGRSMATMERDLSGARVTEGFADAAKVARLNQSFWLDLMLRYGPSDRYSVSLVRSSDGSRRESNVRGVPAERLAAAVAQFPPASGPAQSVSIEPMGGIAIMRIGNLLEPDTPNFLRRAFHKIAGARTSDLIIDLRGNHGGIDWFNSELLSYLSDRPFRFYRSRDFRVRSYADLRCLTYDIDDFLLPEQVTALPTAARSNPFDHLTLPQLIEFSMATDHAGGVQMPKSEDRYGGRTYILVDGMSGSSAAEIPALAHHLGLATIIGEEPNGAYQGEVAGIIPTLTLPNSRLNIRIPLIAYHNEVMPGVRQGRGPEPAFTVPERLEDAVAGVDTVMEFTRRLIASRRSTTREAADSLSAGP